MTAVHSLWSVVKVVQRVALCTMLSALSLPAHAQQPARVWKIGVLVSSSPTVNASRDEALRQGLRELGYVEGQNIVMEYRYAEGKVERLAQLARDLVDQKPDVIVVAGTGVAVAAKNATSTIPIVVAGAGDLVRAGLIRSFMNPGGNVTGVSRMPADFFGTPVKLLKQTLPKASRMAALSNPGNPGHERTVKEIELSTRASGMTLQNVSARNPKELDTAVTNAKARAEALLVMTDAFFNSQLSRIAELGIKNRLPTMYDRTEFAEAGGLMSYGVNLAELSRRAAWYVDQILKGEKPANLSLVEPIKFDFAVNLKTATQIGITLPPEVLKRADRVIK